MSRKPQLAAAPARRDLLESSTFAASLRKSGIPYPTPELRFDSSRRWRFDYAWPDKKIALEVEGGVWTGGRHTRGKGFLADMEKYNSAAAQGWRVLRCTPSTLCKTATIELLKEVLL